MSSKNSKRIKRKVKIGEKKMDKIKFDDLLYMRKGDKNLTMGQSPSKIEKIITVEEWEVKAKALREIFFQMLGETPQISCPLSSKIIEENNCGDYIKRKIEYFVEPDEKISAYVLIPKNLKTKVPAILCIHPTTPLGKEQTIGNDNTEKGQDRAYALHLVKRGYITMSYDLLTAGERCYKGYAPFDTAPFYKKYPKWSVRGKDLWDVSRAIDFLQSMDEVDSERIGSIGHSQGGGITIHSMVLDKRIKVGVSSCGMWPERLSKNPFNWARTGWWVGIPFLRPYCYTGKHFPLDMHEYLGLIAPRAIMNISALNDCMYTIEEENITRDAFNNLSENVSKVFSLYKTENNFKNIHHMNGHSFLLEQREIAYAFLDKKLRGNNIY